MSSIKENIFANDNNYLAQEHRFRSSTNCDFFYLDEKCVKLAAEFVSIIIPVYRAEHLDMVLDGLNKQSYKNFELIIANDCSSIDLTGIIKSVGATYHIKYIRNVINRGRPINRNIGISVATAETIIILDQDMIIQDDFVAKLVVRQQFTNNCIFVCFKEDINYEYFVTKINQRPRLQSDWRCRQIPNENFINLAIKQCQVEKQSREYRLLEESDNFKNFGGGYCIGFWDLPSIVISHSLCFKKSNFVEAGGFLENVFAGWGVEDQALGACFLANGNYIVPAPDCVSFHLNHRRYSGSREKEWSEFKNNLRIYLNFVTNQAKVLRFKSHAVIKKKSDGNIDFYECSD